MQPKNPNGNQGEGDRISARHYNKAAREFVEGGHVDEAAREAAIFVDSHPDEAKRSERTAKRGPRGTRVSVDELVDMGKSVMDRVRPYVSRAIERVKSTLRKH